MQCKGCGWQGVRPTENWMGSFIKAWLNVIKWNSLSAVIHLDNCNAIMFLCMVYLACWVIQNQTHKMPLKINSAKKKKKLSLYFNFWSHKYIDFYLFIYFLHIVLLGGHIGSEDNVQSVDLCRCILLNPF